MQSEGATALKGRLQKGIDIPIDMSKSMEGKCLFDKHELYVCVCVCAWTDIACMPCPRVLVVLLIFKFCIVKTDLVSNKGLSALLGFYPAFLP